MGLSVKVDTQKKRQLPPEDLHLAGCYGIVDLGTSYDEMYKRSQRKGMFFFELPDCTLEFEKDGVKQVVPHRIMKEYQLRLSNPDDTKKTALTLHLQAWRGKRFTDEELKSFDLKNVLGKFCMLQVGHDVKKNGEEKAVITAVSKVPKGITIPKEMHNELIFFSLDEFDGTIPPFIPEWCAKRIMESDEYKRYMANRQTRLAEVTGGPTVDTEPANEQEEDEDLPF